MTMQKDSNKSLSILITQTAERHWQRLEEVWSEGLLQLTLSQQQELKTVLGLSDYVATQLSRHPEWIRSLFAGDLQLIERQSFDTELHGKLASATSEDMAKAVLRRFRNYQMVRLAWRDFLDYASLEESLLDLSALAEALVICARDWLYKEMCAQYGTPMDKAGTPQPLLILGMGKLGGRELNFSSDIDLIFTFPEHGETVGGRRSLDNQQFFIRMGQRLVNLLDQISVDGFVFRVDMRLRPYGESGPLVAIPMWY